MMAISLHQPFATLLLERMPNGERFKTHETRSRAAPQKAVGQRVLIHAARTLEGTYDDGPDDDPCTFLCRRYFNNFDTLPRGCFVGTALLSSQFQMRGGAGRAVSLYDLVTGNWDFGRWAWRMDDPELFPQPIWARGRQGWWNVEWPPETAT